MERALVQHGSIAQGSNALTLDTLIQKTPPTFLVPYQFFVAWDGVLTLAYKGFPQELANLKSELDLHFPELPKENPGSKWPKTSLAALSDASSPLTLAQLTKLREVCDEFNKKMEKEWIKENKVLHVDRLSVVMYCSCSLEKRFMEHSVNLEGDGGDGVRGRVDAAALESVDNILSEFGHEHLEEYLPRVATGRNKISHYRGPKVLAPFPSFNLDHFFHNIQF